MSAWHCSAVFVTSHVAETTRAGLPARDVRIQQTKWVAMSESVTPCRTRHATPASRTSRLRRLDKAGAVMLQTRACSWILAYQPKALSGASSKKYENKIRRRWLRSKSGEIQRTRIKARGPVRAIHSGAKKVPPVDCNSQIDVWCRNCLIKGTVVADRLYLRVL